MPEREYSMPGDGRTGEHDGELPAGEQRAADRRRPLLEILVRRAAQ
ncbi:hypothetical protein ACFY0F_06015 [Streptomyces sp. NPDC001544]